jgi:REP element-mobilizing transposase RayT
MKFDPTIHHRRSTWLRLQDFFPICHDEWVIMPNHLHAIIWIQDSSTGEASTARNLGFSWPSLADASPQCQAIGTRSGSLGAIIQNFKSISSRKINQDQHSPGSPGAPTWQRNYYEHITRNQAELERIRQYIADNPRHWAEDQENPR